MSTLPAPRTLADLTADFVRRVVTYTPEVTYFGENSGAYALGVSAAQLASSVEAQARAVLRRDTLLGATGDALVEVAEEAGVPKLGATRAQVLVIVQPWAATVTAITTNTLLEVDDSTHFEAGDSIRITSADGTSSEVVTIAAVTTGTGPAGGDELEVGLLVGTYDTDAGVSVLKRHTLLAGTEFKSTAGVNFESLEDLTIGDANPVLAGESTALALADKVLCEAVTPGAAGNVEAETITDLVTPDDDVRAIFNPFAAQGGEEAEADFSLKYRTAHQPQLGAISTQAFLETLARNGNTSVLRAFPEDSDAISTLRVRVLTRSGGGLSVDARDALARFMAQRTRAAELVEVRNVVPTAIEIEADVSLDPGSGSVQTRLNAAGRRLCDAAASFLDWRKWAEGATVDEADLLGLVKTTPGIANVVTSSFQPADDTEVPAASVPMLVRVVLREVESGKSFGVDLATSY